MLRLFITTVLLVAGSALMGQEMSSRDTLVSDFKTLVKFLEDTHPDPYSGFGGKVFFHQKAFDVEQELLVKKHTHNEFSQLAQEFLAPLEDGHTYLLREQSKAEGAQLYIPVFMRVIPNGLIIDGVPDTLQRFLGSRLKTVDGVLLEKLLEKVAQHTPCENLYGGYKAVALNFSAIDFLRRLLPEMGATVTLGVEMPVGGTEQFTVSVVDRETWNRAKLKMNPSWEEIEGMNNLTYRFLDEEQKIMYYRLRSVAARESFLFMQQNGWDGFTNQVKSFYQRTLKKEMPEDMDEAIAGIPTMAEQFGRMLTEMKKQQSKYLIIDLCANGGGFTPITLPTLYQLYGDRYLQTDMDVRFYRLLSPLYMQKMNTTLEKFNEQNGTLLGFGDYVFENESSESKSPEALRKEFVEQAMGNAAEYIDTLNGQPIYSPEKVFVIINEGTFSAAFHYAFYLWKMGATVVGVPSSQAPNTFMEQTSFELPLTGMKGSISNSAQYFLPPTDPRAKTFYPDIILKYEDYKRYNFDWNAELRYLMDTLENEK